jgi:hypothetical protein
MEDVVDGDVESRVARSQDYDRIVAVIDDWWERPVRASLPRLFLDHFWATSRVAMSGVVRPTTWAGARGTLARKLSASIRSARLAA